jgi:hypothetical protein
MNLQFFVERNQMHQVLNRWPLCLFGMSMNSLFTLIIYQLWHDKISISVHNNHEFDFGFKIKKAKLHQNNI